jgi:hypothetical protein
MEKIDKVLVGYISEKIGNSKTEQEIKFWQRLARQIYKENQKRAKVKKKDSQR